MLVTRGNFLVLNNHQRDKSKTSKDRTTKQRGLERGRYIDSRRLGKDNQNKTKQTTITHNSRAVETFVERYINALRERGGGGV